MTGIPVPSGQTEAIEEAIRSAKNCCMVFLETPANPTMIMTDIERAAAAAARHPDRPVVMVDNTFLGPTFQHPLMLGATSDALLRDQVSVGLQRHAGRSGHHRQRRDHPEDPRRAQHVRQHPAAR